MRLSYSALTLVLALPGLAFAQTPPPPRPGLAPAAAEAPVVAAPAPAPTVEIAAAAPAEAPAAAPAPAAPAAPPVTWTFEGLVDAYYMYNFTGDPKTQGPALRQFDNNANSFTLNYVKLGAQADTEFFALRADIGAGHTAAVINAASLGAYGTTVTGEPALLYGNGLLVQQAFATLKVSPQLTFDFGRFATNAGGEVIESNKNWIYSRSLLFYGIPLLHTGVRLGYQASPMLKVQASIVNGWNNDPDSNSDKTYGLSLTLTPPDSGLTAILNTYFGKEAAGADTTMLVDAVVTKDIGAVSVGGNVDYYKLGDANWFGIAAMGKYTLSDSFNLAGRLEYIKSKNGYGGLDGSLYEVTVQGAYTVNKHYELRAEFRFDGSDKDTIFKKGAEAKKNQATGLLAALAYF